MLSIERFSTDQISLSSKFDLIHATAVTKRSLHIWSAYLDGQRVQIDLLQGLDLHVLNQAPQLGDGDPLPEGGNLVKSCFFDISCRSTYNINSNTYFLVLGLATPGTAAPSTASAASTAPAAATSAKTSAKTSSTTGVVRHLLHGLNKSTVVRQRVFLEIDIHSESVEDFNQMKPRSMAAMFGDRDIHSILTNCSFSTSVNYLI